jgi:tetratricopeptide (TPR) repeat protein
MERLYLKEAIEDYNKAIELNPNDYLYYLDRGKAKYLVEDLDGANLDFIKSMEIKPNSLDLLYSLGTFYIEQEKFNEAIVYLDKLLVLDNDDSRAYLNRGFAKNALEKFEEALVDLDRAIELEPDLGYMYLQRGYSKLQLGFTNEACIDFNKADTFGDKNAKEYIEDYCQ